MSGIFGGWDGHCDSSTRNGGHGNGGTTKKKSQSDVVVIVYCVSTQITGTGGLAKTNPFLAQNLIPETSSKSPDLCTTNSVMPLEQGRW